MNKDVSIISQAISKAYKASEPDLLPDIAARTIIYDLEKESRLLTSKVKDSDIVEIANKIEEVISNPHSTNAHGGLSMQILAILIASGLLK